MSSDFVVEQMIHELRDAGWTLRAIAARVGLSRSRVPAIDKLRLQVGDVRSQLQPGRQR